MLRPLTPISPICDPYGLLLRRDAVAVGIDDNALARLVRARVLVRMRQGAYCLYDVWTAVDDAERARLLARAVIRQYPEDVALSHDSSCLAQTGPAFGLDLANAHLTHFQGSGRNGSRIVHHHGVCRVGDIRRFEDGWMTIPGRGVLEVTNTRGVEAGLVQANHFLHTGQTTHAELQQLYAAQERWPGSLAQHPVLLLADARIESVGETRSSSLFFRQGLPRPEPQFEIFDLNGELAGRVDFAWPEYGVIVEFDGAEKYHRYRKEGESIEQMVMREKAREDRLREITGWIVIRLTWADLAMPQRTAERIRRAFAQR